MRSISDSVVGLSGPLLVAGHIAFWSGSAVVASGGLAASASSCMVQAIFCAPLLGMSIAFMTSWQGLLRITRQRVQPITEAERTWYLVSTCLSGAAVLIFSPYWFYYLAMGAGPHASQFLCLAGLAAAAALGALIGYGALLLHPRNQRTQESQAIEGPSLGG